MKRGIALSVLIAVLLAAGVFAWAHWVPSPDDILVPVPFSAAALNLKGPGSEPRARPILVVLDTRDTNVFASYVTEILKAEGIFAFESVDLSATRLTDSLLKQHALVITATGSSALLLYQPLCGRYVAGGGRLLMIAPPPEFDSLLGIVTRQRMASDGYVRFDTSSETARGLTTAALQYFGPARICSATTSEVVGWLAERGPQDFKYPAFGTNSYGSGNTAYVVYDLGRSTVYLRQGKPHVGTDDSMHEKDDDGIFTTSDLFRATFDYTRALIPQADEQQKLFVKLVYRLLEGASIIPRVWYFPDGQPSVALLTGDAHYTQTSVIKRLVEYVETRGGRFTLIDYPSALDIELAHDLAARGHGVAPHIYYPRPDNKFFMRVRMWIANWFSPAYFYRPRLSDLNDEVKFAVMNFRDRMNDSCEVTRMHYLTWWGWSETARLLAQNGVHMDFSITGMNPRAKIRVNSLDDPPYSYGYGYINGSGQPMRFVSSEGGLIDLFSQVTQVEDDVMGAEFVTEPPDDSLTVLRIAEANKRLVDESIDQYHTALVYNFHPDHTVQPWPAFVPPTWKWVTATIDYLAQRRVRMLSANNWFRFVKGRYGLSMANVFYDPLSRTGKFTVAGTLPIDGLTLLIPMPQNVTVLKSLDAHALADGKRVNRSVSTITVDKILYTELILNLEAGLPVVVEYAF